MIETRADEIERWVLSYLAQGSATSDQLYEAARAAGYGPREVRPVLWGLVARRWVKVGHKMQLIRQYGG